VDFLFAIPSFIFHVIGWIIGIFLWPFKLIWGLFIGTGKVIFSVLLAPFLLFSHPANVSAAQPATPTPPVPAILNSQIEQIFNDIQQLELAGRQMEYSRNEWRNGNSTQCGILMRDYQNKAKKLVDKVKDFPPKYIALGSAAGGLEMCVSCMSSAQESCDVVRMNLNDYQSMMSEE